MRPLSQCVMYQIMLRDFCDEGTLKAAAQLLDHVASLGVDIVYLCPVTVADDEALHFSPRSVASGFNNPRNPYRMKDYLHIDPEYGTDEDMVVFVNRAHELGMRVLMDLVCYHCGPGCALVREHPEYFLHEADGSVSGGRWNMCVFDYSRPGLRDCMKKNMCSLIQRFNIDGFRCDVGDAVPADFWEEAAEAVRAVKADVIMLDEGVALSHIRKAFDLNYGIFLAPILKDLLCGGKTDVRGFEKIFRANIWVGSEVREALPAGKYSISGLENHDVANDAYDERADAVLPREAVEAACLLSFLTESVPILYNGFEIADGRRHSIWANRFCANRIGIDWSRAVTVKGMKRLAYVRQMTALRHEHAVFGDGELLWQENVPETVISFTRRNDDETVHVTLNLSETPVTFDTPWIAAETPACFGATRAGALLTLGAFGYAVEKE